MISAPKMRPADNTKVAMLQGQGFFALFFSLLYTILDRPKAMAATAKKRMKNSI